MVAVICIEYHNEISDTDLPDNEVNLNIWEHFCSFHTESLSGLTVFQPFLRIGDTE